jgi:uncharacterized protein YbjT (DUF2867 family)
MTRSARRTQEVGSLRSRTDALSQRGRIPNALRLPNPRAKDRVGKGSPPCERMRDRPSALRRTPQFRVHSLMKLILFGATGMVGMGALREMLAEPDVEAVLSVSRRSCGVEHPKLRELLLADLFDFGAAEAQLTGWDGALWAVGISSVGLDEVEYAKVSEELTLVWARALVRLNPKFSFCYCSGAGADRDVMWARVRRRVEVALEAMPFQHAGVVRPGFIRPGPGIRSRVKLYQFFITVLRPLFPLVMAAFPARSTTSELLGRAMLRVVQGRADKFILECSDINRLGALGRV